MKKIFISLMMVVVAITGVGQDIGEQMFIYHGGTVTGGFLPNAIDSITYSYYDVDSVMYDDIVTQEIYTPDSIYRIPLAEIDSVSFYTPSTVYQPDAFVLSDELKSYIVSANTLTMTLSSDVPSEILPKVGDKVVSVECNDNLPFCFMGEVKKIEERDNAIVLQCDSIGLGDVLQRFYRAFHSRPMPEDYYVNKTKNYAKKVLGESHAVITKSIEINLLDFNISLKPINGDPFNWGAKAGLNFSWEYDCIFDGFIALDLPLTFKINVFGNYKKKVDYSAIVCGHIGASFEKPFTPIPIPLMKTPIEVYLEPGGFFNIDGNIYWQSNLLERYKGKLVAKVDVIPNIPPLFPFVNYFEKKFDEKLISSDVSSEIMSDITAEIGLYVELGVLLPLLKKEKFFIAVRGETGLRAKTEHPGIVLSPEVQVFFDVIKLLNSNRNTDYYEQIKSSILSVDFFLRAKLLWKVFFDIFSGTLAQGELTLNLFDLYVVPTFYNVKAIRKPGNNSQIVCTSELENDCVFGQKLGFALFDSDDNFIKNQYYEDKEYRKNCDLPSYWVTIDGLEKGKKYKVYPVIKLFGKKEILASPCVEVEAALDVTTLRAYDVKQNSAVLEGQFSGSEQDIVHGNVGFYYYTSGNKDYPSYVSWGDVNNLTDDGIFRYEITDLDPNTIYYYRAVFRGDSIIYGKEKSFKTLGGENLCADGDHPHMIDLGLPSGTKWACCNVGASSPDDSGSYYAWGETSEKSYYNWSSYAHCGGSWDKCYDLGSDIAGTQYDVAKKEWGGSWMMPTIDQIDELLANCKSEWTNLNGVRGCKFTGKNGGSVFLPAAGFRWADYLYSAGEYSGYWSSTQDPSYSTRAYGLHSESGSVNQNSGSRFYGHNVRPVSK